jgi:hypothetical protein
VIEMPVMSVRLSEKDIKLIRALAKEDDKEKSSGGAGADAGRDQIQDDGGGCAGKLLDGLAGESPASADYPVGTVVISGDGAGDQTVGSPEVKALDGWIYSGPLRQEGKPSSRS